MELWESGENSVRCWTYEGVMFVVWSKSQVCCLRKQTLKSPWFLCIWWFWGEACVSPLVLPRGEMRARCRSVIRNRIDIANFGGDIKLFLCVAYWMYQTHIQLRSLDLRRIDKGSNELYCFSLMVPCCCWYWSTDDRRLYRTKSFCKKDCVWQLTQFLQPGKEIRLE